MAYQGIKSFSGSIWMYSQFKEIKKPVEITRKKKPIMLHYKVVGGKGTLPILTMYLGKEG